MNRPIIAVNTEPVADPYFVATALDVDFSIAIDIFKAIEIGMEPMRAIARILVGIVNAVPNHGALLYVNRQETLDTPTVFYNCVQDRFYLSTFRIEHDHDPDANDV